MTQINKIDYSRIDFDEVLNYYNVQRIKRRGDERTFSCPFPEHKRGDRNPSASINTSSGIWHCFSCGRKGKLANFVAELENVSLQEAEKKLRQSYDRNLGELKLEHFPLQKEVEVSEVKDWIDEEDLRQFDVDWDMAYDAYQCGQCPEALEYPFKRGFELDTIHYFRIGYDRISDRITIPYRDIGGKLVGIKGRAVDPEEEPRYRALGDKPGKPPKYGFPTFRSVDYLYGLDHRGETTVVEGEFDTQWIRQHDAPAVGLSGSNPTMEQARLLFRYFDTITIMLDPDEAGIRATKELINKIYKCGKGIDIYIASLPGGNDPNDMPWPDLQKVIHSAERHYPVALL